MPICGGENDVALSLIRLCEEVLPCSNTHKEVLPCSDSHGLVYDCDKSSDSDACYLADNRMSGNDADATNIGKDVECHRIDKKKLIESVVRSENVDNLAREDGEKSSLIHELRLQISKRDGEIEELVRKGKQREVEHTVAIEVKDAEIADLNESILDLLHENDQLSAELNVIHNITQRHISNSQNVSPRIRMKRLKRKSRIGTEDPQFANERKRQKRTTEGENEERPSDKDVNNSPIIP